MHDDGIDTKYLIGPEFSVPPAELFKKFARYATDASRGFIENVPAVRTITQMMSSLFSGIQLETGIRLEHGFKQDIHAVRTKILTRPYDSEMCSSSNTNSSRKA